MLGSNSHLDLVRGHHEKPLATLKVSGHADESLGTQMKAWARVNSPAHRKPADGLTLVRQS